MNKTNILSLILFISLVKSSFSQVTDSLHQKTSYINRNFSENFKDKYKEDAFIYESQLKKNDWWDNFIDWLSQVIKDLFDFKDLQSSRDFVSTMIDVLAVVLIIFAVYLIVKALIKGEGNWFFSTSTNKQILNFEEIEKNIHLINFEKEIKEHISKKEYRNAIRLYYLWLLKKMSDKNIIEWDVEKTNSDYYYEIANSTIKKEFNYLSYLYNYIWYGGFSIDEDSFKEAKNSFEKTINAI